MFQNAKFLTVAAATLALTLSGLSAAFAELSTSPDTTTGTSTESGASTPDGKTSDRTPGDPSPARTPNATEKGAVGTDAAQTPEGTSDRTPNKQDAPSDN